MAEKKEKLFDMFPPVSTEEWMAKITTDLKGADFNKKLVWRTNEGFNVQPFYREEDLKDLKTLGSLPGQFPYVRGTRANNDWRIRQTVSGETAAEIHDNAVHCIDRGVDSIAFKAPKEMTAEQLAQILDGIDLQKIEVNILGCPCCAIDNARLLVDYVKAHGAADYFKGSVAFDPFRRMLVKGKEPKRDIAEAANENDINVRAAAIACVVLSMAPPKNTGRMTKIFFIQCVGRATFIMCFMFIAVYFLPDGEIFGIDVFFLL